MGLPENLDRSAHKFGLSLRLLIKNTWLRLSWQADGSDTTSRILRRPAGEVPMAMRNQHDLPHLLDRLIFALDADWP